MATPPPRLLDDPSTGEQVRSILDAGTRLEPPPGLQDASWTRLEQNLGAPPVPPAAPGVVWIVGGGLIGAGALAFGLAWPPSGAPTPAPPRPSVAAAAIPASATAAPTAERDRPPSPSAVPPAPRDPSAVQLDDLPSVPVPPRASGSAAVDATAESALVQEARAKLRGGDAGGALAALAEADKKFPGGTLSVERAVLRITALDRAGRKSEAKAGAQSFVKAHPDSPYAERLKSIAGEER